MFQGERMVLEGRMQIGHGWMTCVTGLGKEAKIGKPQLFYHTSGYGHDCFRFPGCGPGMEHEDGEQPYGGADKE